MSGLEQGQLFLAQIRSTDFLTCREDTSGEPTCLKMQGQLMFRATFIHFQEEEAEEDSKVASSLRSRSAPPGRSRESWNHGWEEKNAASQRYVRKLLASPTPSCEPEDASPDPAAQEPHESVEPLEEEPSPEGPVPRLATPAVSCGSVGHPGLCRRPCVHFAKARPERARFGMRRKDFLSKDVMLRQCSGLCATSRHAERGRRHTYMCVCVCVCLWCVCVGCVYTYVYVYMGICVSLNIYI